MWAGLGEVQAALSLCLHTLYSECLVSREAKNPSVFIFIVLNEIRFKNIAYKFKNFNRH